MSKKIHKNNAVVKLRLGATVPTPVQEAIDLAVDQHQREHKLADYEAAGGNYNNLRGEALLAYLDLQEHKQKRQTNKIYQELNEIVNRIGDHLNASGFLASINLNHTLEDEKETAYFRIIAECQGKETGIQANIEDYIDMHLAKSKHQYDVMKEIEQWFHELLADKSMEKEFNAELENIKERHREQSIAKEAIEDTIGKVGDTGQKLKHIGEILALSTASGVKITDGPPPEKEDTVLMTIPSDNGNDLQIRISVILDDEALFRDVTLQQTAQQYLKGLVFYGAAAKHKNKAGKRKVTRLALLQLDAIFKVLERLREIQKKHTHELGALAAKLEDTMQQKDIMNRENERYRVDTKETEEVLNKIIKEHETLKTEHAKTIVDIRECRRRLSSGQQGNAGSFAEGEEDRGRESSQGYDRSHKSGSKGSKARSGDQGKSGKGQGARTSGPGTIANEQETGQVHEHDESHHGGPGSLSKPHDQSNATSPKTHEPTDHPSLKAHEIKAAATPPSASTPTGTKKHSAPRRVSIAEQTRRHHEPDPGTQMEQQVVRATPEHGSRRKSVTHEHPLPGTSDEDVGGSVLLSESEVERDGTQGKADQPQRKKKIQSKDEGKKPAQSRRQSQVTPEDKPEMKKVDVLRKKVLPKEKGKPEIRAREASPAVPAGETPELGVRETHAMSPEADAKVLEKENVTEIEKARAFADSAKARDSSVVATESLEESEPEEEAATRSPAVRSPRTEEIQVVHREIQVNLSPQITQVHRSIPVQASFIGDAVPKTDVEVQPSFADAKTSEQEALAEAQEQLDAQDETIAELSAKIEQLQSTEERAKQLEVMLEMAEQEKQAVEAAMDELRTTIKTAEDEAEVLGSRIAQLDYEVSSRDTVINNLQQSVDVLEETLRILRANKITVETTTTGYIFGTTVDAQTDDLTPPDVKEELRRLKSILGHFRKSLVMVLADQDLIADVPSFPHQLKDTWNANTAAAEITDDVKQHFGAIPAIFQGAFTKLRAEHRAAFTTVLEQKASEMEGDLRGTDSNEEMRRARMKLRQRVLDLEVENTHIRHTLKRLNEVLEQRRSEFDTQIDQKKVEISKYRDEIKRIKDLAWTLAEALAKLRDEAIAAMPERKSIVDMITLLRNAEKRLGKTLRKPVPQKKPAPQMQIHGVHQETFSDYADERTDSPKSVDVPRSSILLDAVRSMESNLPVSPTFDTEIPNKPKHVSVLDRQTSVSWTVIRKRSQDTQKHQYRTQGTTTNDRVNRSYVEYTRYLYDPQTELVRSETRKVTQESRTMQTTGPVDLFIKGSAYTGAFPRNEEWTAQPDHPNRKKRDTKDDDVKKKVTLREKELNEPIIVTGTKLHDTHPEGVQAVPGKDEIPPSHQAKETVVFEHPKGFKHHRSTGAAKPVDQEAVPDHTLHHNPGLDKVEQTAFLNREVPLNALSPERSAYSDNQAHRSLDAAIALLITMEAETVAEQARNVSLEPGLQRAAPKNTAEVRKVRDHVMNAKGLLQKLEDGMRYYAPADARPGSGQRWSRKDLFERQRIRDSPYSEEEPYRKTSREGSLQLTEELRKAERQMREDIKNIAKRRQMRRASGISGIRQDQSSPESDQRSPSERSDYRKRTSQNRENKMADSKRQRQRRISELDQAVGRFLRNGPVWDRPADQKIKAFHTSISPTKARFASPEKPALGSHKPIYIEQKAVNQLPPQFTAVGLSLEPGEVNDYGEAVEQLMPVDRNALARDAPYFDGRSQNERLNTTIAQKLQFLKEQRRELIVGPFEKTQKNPLIRTHRGEEPLEGPLDAALHNFPDMGVIGRGIQESSPKEISQHWNPESSVAKGNQLSASPHAATGVQTTNPPKEGETQTPSTTAINTLTTEHGEKNL